ncbi:hypothetical protein BgiBS90_007426, partial [Biomphalaria glabrata]
SIEVKDTEASVKDTEASVKDTEASVKRSKCEGYRSKCEGYRSKCEGYRSKCEGYRSHWEGNSMKMLLMERIIQSKDSVEDYKQLCGVVCPIPIATPHLKSLRHQTRKTKLFNMA